jgi:hypothetical protein
VETSKLKLRLAGLSVESFETRGGGKEGTLVGGQDAPGAVRDDGAAPESGDATCAGVTCWETCGRTCYDTCRLLDCGF